MKFLLLYLIYFHSTYIQEDWDSYTKIGRMVIFPFWFIRSIIYWIISPIFIPQFLIKSSKLFKKFKNIEELKHKPPIFYR